MAASQLPGMINIDHTVAKGAHKGEIHLIFICKPVHNLKASTTRKVGVLSKINLYSLHASFFKNCGLSHVITGDEASDEDSNSLSVWRSYALELMVYLHYLPPSSLDKVLDRV